MTTINDTYINALLADSAYVNGLTPGLSGDSLKNKLAGRMTPELAKYIGDNFTVVTQFGDGSAVDGFNATVWKDNSGKTYVSMRGTQEAYDATADIDLAASGVAYTQMVDMVNWWMRESTASGPAKQIAFVKIPVPGTVFFTRHFVAATSVASTGTLSNLGVIQSVNGHSLGGYLASAFVRIFGQTLPATAINTFNSAGFSRPALALGNIDSAFNEIAGIIGANYGLGDFSSAQNNYYAQNGLSVTTNNLDPLGFKQFGVRIPLYQEDTVHAPLPANNHFMFKLTDMLALGNAFTILDSTLDLKKFATFVKAGSNKMEESYESVLDGLRKMLLGASVTKTKVGDANGGNDGPQPDARVDYHKNLSDLVKFDDLGRPTGLFKDLAGKVIFNSAPSNGLSARNNFGDFLSLYYLAPFTLTTLTTGAEDKLITAQGTLGTAWQADKVLSKEDLALGKATFSDEYLVPERKPLFFPKAVRNFFSQWQEFSRFYVNAGGFFNAPKRTFTFR